MYLGRLSHKKGLDILIRAFAIARRDGPACRLAIVGPDDEGLTVELSALARREGVADHVVFTGMLSGVEKLDALAAASIWALPSHTENFGIAAAEAFAAGRATVIKAAVSSHRRSPQDAAPQALSGAAFGAEIAAAAAGRCATRWRLARAGADSRGAMTGRSRRAAVGGEATRRNGGCALLDAGSRCEMRRSRRTAPERADLAAEDRRTRCCCLRERGRTESARRAAGAAAWADQVIGDSPAADRTAVTGARAAGAEVVQFDYAGGGPEEEGLGAAARAGPQRVGAALAADERVTDALRVEVEAVIPVG
jgi:hypothetical protein